MLERESIFGIFERCIPELTSYLIDLENCNRLRMMKKEKKIEKRELENAENRLLLYFLNTSKKSELA